MAIEWSKLCTLRGARSNAFEELVCQLAREENIPDKTVFARVAAPDGGVEAFWVTNLGDEYAWQAKFFEKVEKSQWDQLTESFQRAVTTHPRLRVYYVCMPLDRQDPRVRSQLWFMDKWNRYVAKWQAFAKSRGMSVEIEYWGSSEIIHRLSHDKHVGRRKFWFNEIELSDEWFKIQVQRETLNLGERYSADLNVGLDASRKFEAISRSNKFKAILHSSVGQLNLAAKELLLAAANLSVARDGSRVILNAVSELRALLYLNDADAIENINVDRANSCLSQLRSAIETCNARENGIQGPAKRLGSAITDVADLVNSNEVLLFNNRVMLLKGSAGIGKSHLLSDAANNLLVAGHPCLLMLGQHFVSDEPPWAQILKSILRLNCSEHEFLGALNAKAEALKVRIVVFIDAINEGRGVRLWPEHIRGFLNDFSQYPWLSLVLSVRTSYYKALIPEDMKRDRHVVKVEHHGFAGSVEQAISTFFNYYNLERPVNSYLHTEYANPLFLKILCKGLAGANLKRLPEGFYGINAALELFVSAIEQRLASASKFDYSESHRLVFKILSALIEYKINQKTSYIPFDLAHRIVAEKTKGVICDGDFLEALISEGVLSKNLYWLNSTKYEEGIYLAYERFEDHLAANYLLEKYSPLDKHGISELSQFVSDRLEWEGLFEALAIQMPEQYSLELSELHLNGFEFTEEFIDAFVYGLAWRSAASIRDETIRFLNEHVLPNSYGWDRFFQMVYSVVLDPNHAFNAAALHVYLSLDNMAVRDAHWTTYLHYQDYEHSAVRRLINWGNSSSDLLVIDCQSRLLGAIALAWLFSSTNIKLRDEATFALSSLLTNNIGIAHRLLLYFENVDDPYVYERILASAYGALLNSRENEEMGILATYLNEFIFNADEVYPNVMVRDYARNIVEYAVSHGHICDADVRCSPPYRSRFPESFPNNDDIDLISPRYTSSSYDATRWSESKIVDSMITEYGRGVGSYGDFGRYTFQNAVDVWSEFDPQALSNWAFKIIFEKFGYNSNLHGEFDRHASSGDRHKNRTERIGKKYQWLALYEVMARLADNHKMRDPKNWSGDEKIWFQGPWEPFLRNIDVTVPLKNVQNQRGDFAWCEGSMAYDDWGSSNETWVADESSLPDPAKFICVSDADGVEWLNLETDRTWFQPSNRDDLRTNTGRQIWYQVRSYLVHEEDAEGIVGWLEQQSFMGRWMPENPAQYQVFAREFYWSPAYEFFDDPYYEKRSWQNLVDSKRRNAGLGSVLTTVQNYRWEGASDARLAAFKFPHEYLHAKLKIKQGESPGAWVNENGETVCFDPSIHNEYGSSGLLVKKKCFLEFLEANKLQIVWTVLGEKQILHGMSGGTHPERWVEVSGVYTFENSRLRGGIRNTIKTVNGRSSSRN